MVWAALRGFHIRLLVLLAALPTLIGGTPLTGDFYWARSICAIQGSGYSSPYWGRTVLTAGVVTLDLDDGWQKGFYLQDEGCDSNPSTSDGIYIFLDEKIDLVDPGDLVQVLGEASEYYGLTEILVNPVNVTILSSGNPLPAPVDLNPPFDNDQARAYFEARESMVAGLEQALVVGPTDADDRTWLVRSDLGVERVFYGDPAGTGVIICADDGGPFEISPEVAVGDQVNGLHGVLDYRYATYCLQLDSQPTIIPSHSVFMPRREALAYTNGTYSFFAATFNLENLFDTLDDPFTDDSVLSATEYQRRLHKRALAIHDELAEPALLAVQEAENLDVLLDLAARGEIQADYGVIIGEGPDRRGMDVALLYRIDRAQILGYWTEQGCTTLIDGLGPDGNLDVDFPHNEVTCDSDGDHIPDGNRLFSRPPLVVRLFVCRYTCPDGPSRYEPLIDMVELYVIINHWKSKVQDSTTVQYTLPRRIQQAQYVIGLVDRILESDPAANLLVTGDLNDHPNSTPLSLIKSKGFTDLLSFREEQTRYTYVYRGISQVLDYVLLRPQPGLIPVSANAGHFNADYPYMLVGDENTSHRSSDHDPVAALFGVVDEFLFLPIVMH